MLGEFCVGDLGEILPEGFHVEEDLEVSMDCNLELTVFSSSSTTMNGRNNTP